MLTSYTGNLWSNFAQETAQTSSDTSEMYVTFTHTHTHKRRKKDAGTTLSETLKDLNVPMKNSKPCTYYYSQ